MKKIIIPLFVSFLLISCWKSEEIKQESSVNITNSWVVQTWSIETWSLNTNIWIVEKVETWNISNSWIENNTWVINKSESKVGSNNWIVSNSWINKKTESTINSNTGTENDSWVLTEHIKKFNQFDFNNIKDLYTKDLLTYYYQNLKKERNIENNQTYESLNWKISIIWDWKFIHPVTLTIENKKTWEKNTQIVAYDIKWQENILKNSEKCSKLKVCSDSELENEIINNLDWLDAVRPSYKIFDNNYIIVKNFSSSKLYKIPENGPIDFSIKSNVIISSYELDSVWNSPLLLVREQWSGPDIPFFPCANLISKEDLKTKLSGSRCDLFTLSWIDQFSYNGKLVVFVHTTNQQNNPTEWRYYPKNLYEYVKQESQYLSPETKSLHGEWPKENTFYIYDLSTWKFEKKIEFLWDFNF
ncbi:MAG: hypothetical protein ACD_49C00095G0001 [uncultured bacterium (gcode 4)]|uniref:Lipoprotein n=1 Tax=uncultured bacterium (gcode 4) TaxID=1234023 RepID=K2BU69_9BACT|nr:MAG: hypothetical protein ACD_49C00095G0001 [uncultured bacterium (gcode 4)]